MIWMKVKAVDVYILVALCSRSIFIKSFSRVHVLFISKEDSVFSNLL